MPIPTQREQTFEAWMEKVDASLADELGLTSEDLPDQPYADWFNDEFSISEVIGLIKENLEYDA